MISPLHGIALPAQTSGDCKKAECDGSGEVIQANDDGDVPDDATGAPTTHARDKVDGSACDDGDACSQSDTGQSGACVGANLVVCKASEICVAGACIVSPCAGMVGLPGVPVVPVGTAPWSVAAADLNADGKPNLAVANSNSNTVSALISSGNGTFVAKVDYPTGTSPWAITSADLNDDGRPDLGTANHDSDSVSVLDTTCLP